MHTQSAHRLLALGPNVRRTHRCEGRIVWIELAGRHGEPHERADLRILGIRCTARRIRDARTVLAGWPRRSDAM